MNGGSVRTTYMPSNQSGQPCYAHACVKLLIFSHWFAAIVKTGLLDFMLDGHARGLRLYICAKV